MSERAPIPLPEESRTEASALRARATLLKRLADVVCLPASRINAFERAMTSDLLVELLRDASLVERERVAQRLALMGDPPGPLARVLLRDTLSVARPLLEEAAQLSDADLIACLYQAGPEHRRLIALRRGVSEIVTDALIDMDEEPVAEALLRNDLARLSHHGVEHLVATSRDAPHLAPLLLRRAELRPSHAYVLFWWADAETRLSILQRFAIARDILEEAVEDLLDAAAPGPDDALSGKALDFIGRRQRNPEAARKSPFGSLEAAVAAAEAELTPEIGEEISYLAGLKPVTGAKIFTDPGGEPLAMLCKAAGLPRTALRALWRGLRRQDVDRSGATDHALERALIVYDALSVDRAQTVLRYWNWSMTSGLSPALLKALRQDDESAIDEYSKPHRPALLALSRDFGR
ncbi:DUF2336 domain-containing protein [Caulobacter segnis]|uniref:DUF2336 domain-containing protein n=2 Tax=Caulobacter segnis TaxID=88688 RepID=D5VMQ7_CAUST|nr:DUF2336 domain-containing protein [Caulobacter segnis]ADG11780.1 Protein of unknown function DUF2336 [Caulobacter segnis ATCC 21756]AVQ03418.1 DUF2336 domain-containing protein [Caulobacter segnis]